MTKTAVMTKDLTLAQLQQPDMTPDTVARLREPAVYETFTAALAQHRTLVAERDAMDRTLENRNEASEYDEAKQLALVRKPQLHAELLAAARALKAARTARDHALARTRQWVDDVTWQVQLDLAQRLIERLPMDLVAELDAVNAVRVRCLVRYYPEVETLGVPGLNAVGLRELQKRIDSRRVRRRPRSA